MRRLLPCCAVLVAFALVGRAGQDTSNSELVIKLNVTPAAAPKPALRYLLLPELKEMNPGNPVHNYLKCFMEQQKFFFDKETVQRRDKLLTMPLKELPAQELQDYGHYALQQADWAARLDKPDWGILQKLKIDGIYLLLPDVQSMRTLANALKVRFRAEVALSRFDDAVRTAKTMFAMSRHLGEHPTLIGGLVGMAITAVAIGPLEEMIEQPSSPNLYWALTNLPTPFISLERSIEGERIWVIPEFKDLDENGPMSPEQIQKFIKHLDFLLQVGEVKTKPNGVRSWLDARDKDQGLVSAARNRLVESGFAMAKLQQFPPDQVLLLDAKREYEFRRDDALKLMNLPFWQIESVKQTDSPKESLLLGEFVPAFTKVRQAQARTDQRLGLLRCVEALRLYAAEHNGALPGKLSDVTVPVPDDPVTGKPFRYELVGETAHLRGTPPRGMEKVPPFNVHYEITIQK